MTISGWAVCREFRYSRKKTPHQCEAGVIDKAAIRDFELLCLTSLPGPWLLAQPWRISPENEHQDEQSKS